MAGGYAESQFPPGRLGSYASLCDSGYASVARSGDSAQMAIFIRRAIAFHGGDVLEEDALTRLAQQHCSCVRTFDELLRELETYAWISWPGLRRSASTHLPTPTHADSAHVTGFGADFESDAATASCPGASGEHVGSTGISGGPVSSADFFPDVNQALRGCQDSGLVDAPNDKLDSKAVDGTAASTSSSVGGSSSSSALPEVQLDDVALCAEPFETFGNLVVTAPPWRPNHMFRSRLYSLVLRNPLDPSRGLVLISNVDRSIVSETAHGIVQELGEGAQDSSVYQALQSDPALLASMTQSGSQHASASSLPAASAPAHAANVNPEDEHGQCPICFEDIHAGEAAMRCIGDGGVHHYFHATCLQGWIRACRNGQEANCPICRGRLQLNGQRLQEYLNSEGASTLEHEDRSFLQSLADGLQGNNSWSNMDAIEKTAYAGGILAAAGWGFMLGFTEQHHRSSTSLIVYQLPREHQVAQGVGWLAGLLARIIKEVSRNKNDRKRDRN
eukprot:TRINITY_DN74665_c0_g1_i1.p1 TRINITY_DN74665_c0_g1~~TRINITY_DN74665_c0_g1_i1.p1  ORF type:complete len:520 (+),score=78.48 TRINITY_DN74665_c0_g1_i1:53-1561(+)